MSPADAPEAVIRRIVEKQVAAWNAGDGKAFADHFAEDGSFTNIYGQSYAGKDAFEQRHTAILGSFFRGSSLEMSIRRLRFPAADVAIVELDTVVSGVGEMPPGIRPSRDGKLRTRLMQVYVRVAGAWRIAAHHNVAVTG